MSTPASKAALIALRASSRINGGRIRFIRGSTQSVWINAAWGDKTHETDTSEGVILEHVDFKIRFAAGALILNGQLATPQRGDRFAVENGDTYEVLPIDGGDCYESFGPDRAGADTMMRVHGKKVS